MSVSLIDGHVDDDAMTDNEIIKALECDLKLSVKECPECPYYRKEHCSSVLIQDTIDLINRQKAEKETMQSYIDCLKAEIERLKEFEYMYKDLCK